MLPDFSWFVEVHALQERNAVPGADQVLARNPRLQTDVTAGGQDDPVIVRHEVIHGDVLADRRVVADVYAQCADLVDVELNHITRQPKLWDTQPASPSRDRGRLEE